MRHREKWQAFWLLEIESPTEKSPLFVFVECLLIVPSAALS